MKDHERIPHRRSVRLPGYDYSQTGTYFVTLCTSNSASTFGQIIGGKIHLSKLGTIVRDCWLEIPSHFVSVALDEFVVMPNHLHGILVLNADPGHGHVKPEGFGRPVPSSLASVLRLYKQAVTKRAGRAQAQHSGAPHIWQRNYYEHIIRSQDELGKVREYISTNVLRWACDRYNPEKGVLVSDQSGGLTPWQME